MKIEVIPFSKIPKCNVYCRATKLDNIHNQLVPLSHTVHQKFKDRILIGHANVYRASHVLQAMQTARFTCSLNSHFQIFVINKIQLLFVYFINAFRMLILRFRKFVL